MTKWHFVVSKGGGRIIRREGLSICISWKLSKASSVMSLPGSLRGVFQKLQATYHNIFIVAVIVLIICDFPARISNDAD